MWNTGKTQKTESLTHCLRSTREMRVMQKTPPHSAVSVHCCFCQNHEQVIPRSPFKLTPHSLWVSFIRCDGKGREGLNNFNSLS